MKETLDKVGEGHITKFTCTLCEETTVSPNEDLPEGWIRFCHKDIDQKSVACDIGKLICKKCCHILPRHVPDEMSSSESEEIDEPDE